MNESDTELHRLSESEHESQLLAQLAQARSRLDEAATAWRERLQWQQANAAGLFERRESDRFKADLKALRSDPFAMAGVFGRTWHSAAWLNGLWQAVLAGLSSAAGVTWQQIKNVVTATGGDWRADQADIERGRLVALFISLAPDPEALLKHWVADSLGMTERNKTRKRRSKALAVLASGEGRHRIDQPESQSIDGFESVADVMRFETVMARARHFLAMAPKAEIARAALRATAADETKIWPARAEMLRQAHEAERERCVAAKVVLELGSASDIRETRRLRRDRDRAERLVARLERAIEALRKKAAKVAKRPSTASKTDAARIRHRRDEIRASKADERTFGIRGAESESNFELVEPNTDSDSNEAENKTESTISQKFADDKHAESNSTELPLRRPDPAKVATAWRRREREKSKKSRNGSNRSRDRSQNPGESPHQAGFGVFETGASASGLVRHS